LFADFEPTFRQESCFFWLTGLNDPDCTAYVSLATGAATLFYPNLPPSLEIWMGEKCATVHYHSNDRKGALRQTSAWFTRRCSTRTTRLSLRRSLGFRGRKWGGCLRE
jgi:Xaa-Pro aminopeptidase